jgi:hypothetical protein
MNDAMKNVLVEKSLEIVNSIQSTVGKTAEYAQEQLPDIAQQYIAYGQIYQTTILSLALIASITLFILSWRSAKVRDRAIPGSVLSTTEFFMVSGTEFFMVSGFGSTIIALYNVSETIMVWTAPKVWLIREVIYMFR